MLRVFVLCIAFIGVLNSSVWGQCSPLSPTGNAGFSPQPDQLPCIERGRFFSQVFYLENLDTINLGGGVGRITVDTLIIDSIVNLPCNLQWIANEGDNKWYSTETGCIRLYGTTNDSVGQYDLKVYITAYLPILGKLTGEIQEIIENLEQFIGATGINFDYGLRVIEPGSTCPNFNPADSGRVAQRNCPVAAEFRVNEVKNALLCQGDSVGLVTNPSGTTNPVFNWTPAGSIVNPSVSDPLVYPNARTWYTVAMTDSNGTGQTTYGRVLVRVDTQLPSALFNKSQNNYAVSFNAQETDALSYHWDFGDGDSSVLRNVVHVYDQPGLYEVVLSVTNVCGTSTQTDTINVLFNSVSAVSPGMGISVWPNPSKGKIMMEPAGMYVTDVLHMAVYNYQGKLVHTRSVKSTGTQQIDLTHLGTGVYLIRLESEGRIVANKKIIINQ